MSKKTKVKNPVILHVQDYENKIIRGLYFTVYYRSTTYITHYSNNKGFRTCLKRREP